MFCQRRAAAGSIVGGRWEDIVKTGICEYIDPMFRDLLQGLSARLPSQCRVCRSWPAQVVCEGCVNRFAQPQPRCSSCALPVPAGVTQCGACIATPPPLNACLAAVSYDYPWSRLVVNFKFHAEPGLAAAFALLLRSTPWVEPALETADTLLPMPLSRERLRSRGFNQALLLAQQLAPDKSRAEWLLRLRDTPPQSSLGRAERLRSLDGAFAVEPRQAARLVGQRVVLVDDVMTSGASLWAAARVLRQAGAAHITGLVVARTPEP
jgi:ComF family protein